MCSASLCILIYNFIPVPMCIYAHTHALFPKFSRAEFLSPGQQLEEALGVLLSLCAEAAGVVSIFPMHLHSVFPFSLAHVHRWA